MPEVEIQNAGVSMADYVKARTAGEDPAKAATTPPEKVETAPESATGKTEEEGKTKSGGGFQRRIDKLTKSLSEKDAALQEEREARQRLEARLAGRDPAELAKKPIEQGPRPEPDINDQKYKGQDGWELYNKDVRAWDREQAKLEALKEIDAKTKKETEQSTAQSREKTIADSFQKKYEAAKAKHGDLEELLMDEDSEAKQIVSGSVMDGFILDPENEGIEVLIHLCKNPGEISRIQALSPQKQIRELGKIEESLLSGTEQETSSPQPKKPTLPAPIRPVSTGTAKSAAKPEAMSMEDYAKWRTASRTR